jgi:hypothetical protein
MSQKLQIGLLLFFVFSFLFVSDQSFDQDLGRHIKLGKIIVHSLAVPQTNLFSYTNPDFPFINSHYLFEVLMYLVYGWMPGVVILLFKIAIILAAVWVSLKLGGKSFLLLPISFVILHVLRERTELRPEIFSFLFTSFVLAISYKYLDKSEARNPKSETILNDQNKKYLNRIAQKFRVLYFPISNLFRISTFEFRILFFLPLIQLIWANTHIYFILGLAIQGVVLLVLLKRKKFREFRVFGGVFLSSVLASLVNPNGIQGLLFPLTVQQNYGYSIVENQTLFLLESIGFRDPNILFVKISIVICILSIIWAFFRRTLKLENFIFVLAGVVLSLMNVRSFPYLVFLSLPGVLRNFGELRGVKSLKYLRLLNIMIALVILVESYLYISGVYYKSSDSQKTSGISMVQSMKGATDYLIQKDLDNHIFNNFDIGSYIIYKGYPKYKVFVDGRPEAYPKEFFQDIYIPAQYDYEKFKVLDKQIGFRTVVFSITDQTPWGKNFLQNVVKDPDWKVVYLDNFGIVLVKSDQLQQKNLTEVKLAELDPEKSFFSNHRDYLNIAVFLMVANQPQKSMQYVRKALEVYPDSPVANSIMASVLTSQNDLFLQQQAAPFIQKATPWIWW